MTPERWQQIERVYHEALERDGADGERAAFLDAACAQDEALRREVESLIAHHATATGFLATPAVEAHLPLLSQALRSVRGLAETPAPGGLAGRSLGVYRLEALIGAGGMGEVYRALDTRLNRTLAIKVLPSRLSDDPGRRDRFKREARIVSSLNHPHICALYDVGSDDGIDYLVMEHIEGETLQHRLEQGALPPGRALGYAIQICDALDKAHRRGVVHRDLKPANIMLTKSGVKLLDFGAATWRPPAPGLPSTAPTAERPDGLTAEGVILGTLQYLSPEQLEGKPADARSDIFAFGAVLYEMLSGARAFSGTSQASIISAILRLDPPPVAEVVRDVPPPLARALVRCLAKDPEERWQTANDLLFELRSIEPAAAPVSGPAGPPPRLRRWTERAVWATAVVTAIVFAAIWSRRPDGNPAEAVPDAAPIQFSLSPGEGKSLNAGYGMPFALSPNSNQIVYVAASTDGTRQLWLRSLASALEPPVPIPGTEGATAAFWSPDSQWIGFFAGNALRKVRPSTGISQLVASQVTSWGGAAWNVDDVIVFSAGPGGLSRVPAQGGTVSRLVPSQHSLFWPQFVADGKHFIYAAATPASLCLGSLADDPPRTLMKFPVRISSLVYVPGYVFFVQDGTLLARPFDEARLDFSGEAIRVLDGIPVSGPGRAAFSVSAGGVLAYWPYPVGTPATLQWVDRDGGRSPVIDAPTQYVGFALSPDARQLLFSRATRRGVDIWLRDLVLGTERQITFDGAAFTPQWSPDGTRLAFSGPGQKPPPKLFTKSIFGTDPPSLVADSAFPNFASSWGADGASVVTVRIDPMTRSDLWLHRLGPQPSAERLPISTSFNERDAKVSPDGRWIAYVSDQTGQDEVWLAGFPHGRLARQVSRTGGVSPQWGDRELLYLTDETQFMSVPVTASESDLVLGTPHALFRIPDLAEVDRLVFATDNAYAATSRSQRLLVAVRGRDPNAPPIHIVVNWRSLLKRTP